MASEYTLRIIVQGEDRASGPIGSATGALSGLLGVGQGMLSVFGGNLLTSAFQDISRWLGELSGSAFQAAADFQMTRVQIEGLIAVQDVLAFNQSHMVEQTTMTMQTLTGEQQEMLAELTEKYDDATYKLAAMQERYNKAIEGGKTGAAALELQAHNISELQDKMAGWQNDIAALQAQNGQWVASTQMVAGETTTVAEQMGNASVKAQEYLDWLTEYAVKTPATVQTLTTLSRSFLGANKSIDETKELLTAVTQIQAGMGLKDFQLNRIAYNLAQTQRAMKMTAADIREFGNAGVPVVMVLQTIADKYGISVAEAEKLVKSGKEGVQAWQEGLIEFAGFAFSDSMDRVASTWEVASSNASDFVQSILGMEVIMPTLNAVSGTINDFISFLISNRMAFREFGQQAAAMFAGWGGPLSKAWEAIMRFAGVFASVFGLDGLFPQANQAIEGSNFTGMLGVIDVNVRNALDGLTNFANWLSIALPQAIDIAKPYFDSLVANATALYNWLYTNIPIAIDTVRPYFEWFLQNWQALAVGIGVAVAIIAGPAIVAAISMAGSLVAGIGLLVGPLELVAVAVGFFAAAWTGNWWGVRDTLTGVWNTYVQPILSQVWTWLQTNIPAAVTTTSNFWTGTLQPALTAVWSWMSGTLYPFLESVTNFMSAVFDKAVEGTAGLWQNVLQPAIFAVWEKWSSQFDPAIRVIEEFISKSLHPTVKGLSDFFSATFLTVLGLVIASVGEITKALQDATSWFNSLAEAVRNFKLPDVLTPGSPTPMELGLRGINSALVELAQNGLPDFASASGTALPQYEGITGGGPTTAPAGLRAAGGTIELHFHDVHVRDDQDLYDIAYKVSQIMQEQVR